MSFNDNSYTMVNTSGMSNLDDSNLFDEDGNPKKKKISKKDAFKLKIKALKNSLTENVTLNNFFDEYLNNSLKKPDKNEKNNSLVFSNVMCLILENPYLLNTFFSFSEDYKFTNCKFHLYGKEVTIPYKISKSKPFNLFHTIHNCYKKLYALKYCDTDYVLEKNYELNDIIVDIFPFFSIVEYDINSKAILNQLKKSLIDSIEKQGSLILLSSQVDIGNDTIDEIARKSSLINKDILEELEKEKEKRYHSKNKSMASNYNSCGNNSSFGQKVFQILGYYIYDKELKLKEYKTNSKRQKFNEVTNYNTFKDDEYEEKSTFETFFKLKTFKENNKINSNLSMTTLMDGEENLELVNDLYETGKRCLYTWICK